MSLSSLRSFSSAATTAFDTARFTLKAMAEAAVPPGDPETGAGTAHPGNDMPMVQAPEAEAERSPAEKRRAGIRRGTVLDAYA